MNRLEAQLLEARRNEDQNFRLLSAVREEVEEVSKEGTNQIRTKEEEANTLRRENDTLKSDNDICRFEGSQMWSIRNSGRPECIEIYVRLDAVEIAKPL